MARTISKVIEQGKSAFIAIGATHFVGENGIIELLKDYEITRVL